MTTLHGRLAELADDAPASLPDPGLWGRGTRYQRVRRTGTLVIVVTACLVLVAILGLTWQRSVPPPEPVPANAPGGLPDRIWQPSRWLPGTEDDGPLGQVAALVPADRGSWTEGSGGIAGVSATTGEYRFLDLPDRADDAVALSPDGRHVAYWLVGRTTGSPNDTGSVAGVAIYDTTTGEVERHDVITEHGLAPSTLAWADDDRLLLDYGQHAAGSDGAPTEQGLSTAYSLRVWTVGDKAPVRVDLGKAQGADFAGVAGDGVYVMSAADNYAYEILSLDDPGWSAGFRIPRADNPFNYPVVDQTGTFLAAIWGGRPAGPGLQPQPCARRPHARPRRCGRCRSRPVVRPDVGGDRLGRLRPDRRS